MTVTIGNRQLAARARDLAGRAPRGSLERKAAGCRRQHHLAQCGHRRGTAGEAAGDLHLVPVPFEAPADGQG